MTALPVSRRTALGSLLAGTAVLAAPAVLGQARDKVRFGTNWIAEAEHGGFYQSLVDGTYEKYGLDVEIVPGGPQSNNRMLFFTGRLDFYMVGNLIQTYAALREGVPTRTVAAIFQKDPQCLITHPGVYPTFESMKASENILIAAEGVASYYKWMMSKFGFRIEQVKPYTYNYAPFLLDKTAVQQGYATSDPYKVGLEGGFDPFVHLLADNGFSTYSTMIETLESTLVGRRSVVERFVEASILGYTNFLYGDNRAARARIFVDNPDTTEARMDATLVNMKGFGIVDSGDTQTLGIGAMTDARMEGFFTEMVTAGVIEPDLDWKAGYVLDFVNKGVGLDIPR